MGLFVNSYKISSSFEVNFTNIFYGKQSWFLCISIQVDFSVSKCYISNSWMTVLIVIEQRLSIVFYAKQIL